MLQKLFIQNYAIIDEITVEFSSTLNVITGETGAGKSIIVGALGLILGERADSSVLVNKEKKCVVEGQFGARDNNLINRLLEENDIDKSDELIIRREIAANGKSRAFINDTPVNLSLLEKISRLLVDLHRQFDTLELGDAGFQREVMDALASQQARVNDYHYLYQQWRELVNEIDELKIKQQQFEKETDYNRFQYKELEDAGFRENELEQTEEELKLLQHAEEIKTVLNKIYFDLKETDTPVVQQLKTLLNQLNHYSSFHADLPSIYERLQSAQVELNDIADETARICDHIQSDTGKLDELNERLSLGYKLQKKHGVKTTAELLEIQEQLKEKLNASIYVGDAIVEKENQASSLLEKIRKEALAISDKRKKQIKPFETAVNELLSRVGMPNARLLVEMTKVDPGPFGTDKIEFTFNANTTGKNKGQDYQPIRKVASGGELSRLMLSIKSLVAASIDLPTMIFDEIDTGISGEAARQVGIIMKELAAKRQVICITHQPQIAGKADAHFFVYKEIVSEAVKTNIRLLSIEERISAIAKMLSGEKPTAAAMENAREMVRN